MKVLIPFKALRGLKLGDAVKKVAQAVGVKKPCDGCEKRKEALNRFSLPK